MRSPTGQTSSSCPRTTRHLPRPRSRWVSPPFVAARTSTFDTCVWPTCPSSGARLAPGLHQTSSGVGKGNDVSNQPSGSIPRRPLGTTDTEVSLLGVGGAHIGAPDEAEGIRIIQQAIDAGANFLDNAWEYNDGESERRMGKALAQDGYRHKAFLMTKDCAHDRKANHSMLKLEQSLKRLRTDYLDLWQIH